MSPRQALILGALLAGLAVATGAFGAHWLKGELVRRGHDAAQQTSLADTWEVAVRYQMYHALALLVIGMWGRASNRALRLATALFAFGVAVFSGLLYALVLTEFKILGAIVPIGGVALIAGWCCVLVSAWSQTE